MHATVLNRVLTINLKVDGSDLVLHLMNSVLLQYWYIT
jgi:hypothetical protein